MITLATLPHATAQQVFDQVSSHLLAQGKRSADESKYQPLVNGQADACMYRGPQGLKCAAGCLIGEGEYNYNMECRGWDTLVRHGVVPPAHQELIVQLQSIHDSCRPSKWSEALDRLATRMGLKFTAP